MSLSEDEELELLELEEAEYQASGGKPADLSSSFPTPKTSKLEAGARGLGQGASLNFWDEIAGAGEAIGQSVGVKGLGSSNFSDIGLTTPLALDENRDFSQAYTEGRDKWRGEDATARSDNPGSYMAGELGGGVASAFIPGLNVAKGASLANIAGKGALQGGLMSLGGSEAEDISGLAKDTGKGAALGGAMSGVIGYAAPKIGDAIDWGIGKLASGSDDVAERLAGRALGAERGTIKKLGLDKVKAAGRQALDEGVLSPLASTDDLIARNAAVKSRGGEMMGEVYDAIDDAGKSTFNPMEAASKVEGELGDFYRSPINRGEANQLDNTLESIRMRVPENMSSGPGDAFIPLTEAQKLKQELGKVANWKNNINVTEKEKMARQAYGIVSSQIDEAVESGAQQIGSDGLLDTLKQGKQLYGNASTADSLLENKLAREQGNKILGLTDWGVLGAGGAGAAFTGGASIPGTMALLAGKKGLEKYGAQTSAIGLDKVSQMLKKSPKMAELYSSNPQVFNSMANRLASKMGEDEQKSKPFETSSLIQKTQGSKYAQILQEASQRGENAVASTNFVLQQTDPEYRKMILGNEEEEEIQ